MTAKGPTTRPPNLIDDCPREWTRVDEGHYRLALPPLGITFEIDHLWRDRHELNGELLVTCSMAGARTYGGVLASGSCNLSSMTTRASRAKYLADRSVAPDLDWAGLLEEFAARVITAERAGEPSVILPDVAPESDQDTSLTVQGFPLLLHHAQILFGPGGSAKSFLALYLAGHLERLGYHCLLVDWELSARDHTRRLRRLFGPDVLPRVQYARADRPLIHEIDRLQRIIRTDGVQFAIFDSVAFASQGPPEAAEAALTYFRAVRQLGEIGSLHIAHQVKAADGDKMPFGSVFFFNSARSVWYLKPADVSDPDVLKIGAFERKANLDAIHRAVGYTLTFSPQSVLVESVDVADVGDLAAQLPLWQRLVHLLRRGSMSTPEIIEELGTDQNTVNKTVRRNSERFTRLVGADGQTRIGLVDRTHEAG